MRTTIKPWHAVCYLAATAGVAALFLQTAGVWS